MANTSSCTTDQKPVQSYPYFALTVTEDANYANKATKAKLDWSLTYHASYAVSSGAKGWCKATIDGQEKSTSSRWTYGGKTGDHDVNSGSVYVDRSTSSKNVKFSIWVEWDVSYSGYSYSALTGSGTITISAKTSYTVSYNANGGSGAPGSQTKYAGTDLTLSSTKPTRTGYTFSKWNTNSSGTGANYDPGSTYKTDAGVTLYAQWIPNTYPVTYNNNGGTGAISSQTKTYDVTLKLSSTIPSRNLYNFVTWNTNASGTGINYAPGSNYTGNSALTLYAIWEKSISPPIISGIVIQRCTDSTGSVIDEYNGKYAKIQFNWSCDQLPGNNPVTSITINGAAVTSRGGTFSGSVTEVRGQFSADTSHNIEIVVTDSYGLSTSVNRSLTSAKYAIDFKAGGTGVAFGKVATRDAFDCAYPANFDQSITVAENVSATEVDTSLLVVNSLPVVDFPVAQGTTDDGWVWTKWASGRADCHGVFQVSPTWHNATYQTYSDPVQLALPEDLFIEGPWYSGIAWFWCGGITGYGDTDKDTLYFRVTAPHGYSTETVTVSIECKGHCVPGGGGGGGSGEYNILSIDNGDGTQTLRITSAI